MEELKREWVAFMKEWRAKDSVSQGKWIPTFYDFMEWITRDIKD